MGSLTDQQTDRTTRAMLLPACPKVWLTFKAALVFFLGPFGDPTDVPHRTSERPSPLRKEGIGTPF